MRMKVSLTDNNREIEIVLPTTDRTLKAELYTLRLADYSIRKPVTIKSVSSPVALSVLNGKTVNLDELNYLAKRLDSFDNSELHQFYSGLKHEGFVNLKDMINLTFNIHRYALLTDVSSPASIGRKYILSTQGCTPADDSDDKMYENIGKQLIEEGKFKLTEYGILVVNDTPFEKVYDGLIFPEYHYYDSFLAVDLEHEGKKEFVAIAEDPESLNTAAERLGAESPEDCDVIINSYHVDMEPIIPAFQQILEVEGVIKLSQLVSELANEKMDWAKLRAVADYAEVRSAKNFNIIADRLDEFIYIPKANDEDDVGRYYVNDYKDGNVYSLGIDMEEYFDFQAFGEYMMEEYHGKFIEDGYVCVSDYGCGEFLDELEDEPEYDQGEGVIMT